MKNRLSIVIIVLLVLALGGLCVYTFCIKKCECVECKKNTMDKKDSVDGYTYEEMEGTYKTTLKIYDGEKDVDVNFTLTLYRNGTFRYTYAMVAKEGHLGNYIISGNKIVLNNLFRQTSSPEYIVEKGSSFLTINEDKTITDTNQPYSQYSDTKSITFTKTNDKLDSGIEDMIDVTHLTNKSKY